MNVLEPDLPLVLIVQDHWESLEISSEVARLNLVPRSAPIPSPRDMVGCDLVVVLGPWANGDRAHELAGAVWLALEQGATIVFAYQVRFGAADQLLARQLGIAATQNSGIGRAIATEPPLHPAFREYLTIHGNTDLRFTELPEDTNVLAHSVMTDTPREVAATAVHLRVADQGNLYVVPHHTAGQIDPLLDRLVRAVWAHRADESVTPPAFFEELRLPGEPELVDAITEAEAELARLEGRRAAMTRHKLLIGNLSSQTLEDIVIEELNLVLEGASLDARDVPERGVEDFELVKQDGSRAALGESKAAGGGVTLTHVNQFNSHRTEVFDAAPDELPGLLVVNQFRNDDNMGRRQLAVDQRVIRHAVRMNVLVLRTLDLYTLVARRLAGADDSRELQLALESGGGWLEATVD